jgi:uncharacterized protein YndB with AHSA1/START domain
MPTEIINTTPDCEIVSSRIINASRELVYRAWTDPDHLSMTYAWVAGGVLLCTGPTKETM